MKRENLKRLVSGCAGALAIAVMMNASPVIAVPPNTDLLDCTNIPDTGGGTCSGDLRALCDATDGAAVGTQTGGVLDGFKKQRDQDTLVSKVVSAWFKVEQDKDGDATQKLDQYDAKLNGLACDPDDPKPKINCVLQTNLNTALIAAQGSCGL